MTRSETAKLKQLSNVPTPVPAPVVIENEETKIRKKIKNRIATGFEVDPPKYDTRKKESFVEPKYGIIHTMPMGWSVQESAHGRAYYIDHINKTTTWTRPTTAVGVELPPGWGWGVNVSGHTYYRDHINKTTTRTRPTIAASLKVQRQHRLKGEIECPTCHYRLKVGVECPTCHYRFPNVIARRTHVDKDL